MRSKLPTLVVSACLAVVAPAQVGVGTAIGVTVPLPGNGQDIARDEARQRLYVSVPDQNRIVTISTTTFQVTGELVIAPRPTGLDISHDGTTLYVALNQGSAVAYVDLATMSVTTTVSVGAALQSSLTWDVAEAKPGWIFVSANPGSGNTARIALIRRDLGNAVTMVASSQIIRFGPTFAKDPTGQFLYVGEGFNPSWLYQLDLSQATAPIALQEIHGAVNGAQHAEVSADGSRIYLRSGQILDTQTFLQTGTIGAGPSRLDGSGQRAWVMSGANTLQAWDTSTHLQVRSAAMPCQGQTGDQATTLVVWPDETVVLALVNDRVCGLRTSPAPLIDHLTPARMRFDGAPTQVTISGSFFDLGGPLAVRFGTVAATGVTVVSPNTVQCTVAPGLPGFVDVVVSNGNGSSRLADGFAYSPALLLRGDLQPGGLASFGLLNTSGDLVQVLFGLPPPVAVTVPGIAGTLCLSQFGTWLWIPIWLPVEFPFSAPIPNDPALRGFTLLVQAATASIQPPVAAFSNCVTATIQ